MATKKDLVEAYSFSRRRLVTAFLSGAPGGREVEPSRPGRTLVGGVALAVLVAAGGAVAGVLSDHTTVDWSKPALVSEKETGALYVNLPAGGSSTRTSLLPVVNVTSAMLLLGPDITPTSVPHDDISSRDPGDQIGILQAPTTPPPAASLVQDGWTSCTGPDGSSGSSEGGITTTVSRRPDVTPAPDAGLLVRAGGVVYLVAESGSAAQAGTQRQAYALPVPPAGAKDNFLGKLTGTLYDDATPVPQDWVDLFPVGSALTGSSFEVSGLGQPGLSQVPTRGGRKAPRNGDFFRVAGDPDLRVLTGGTFAELDPFSSLVYPYVRFPGGFHPRELTPQQLDPSVANQAAPLTSRTHWPTAVTAPQPEGDVCAVLDTSVPDAPAVSVATTPTTSPDAGSSLPGGRRAVSVDSGAGALVESAAPGATAASRLLFLVDDQGLAHQLDPVRDPTADADARTQLGYADVPDVLVPDAWLELFDAGTPLSVDLARCPPTYALAGASTGAGGAGAGASGSGTPSCQR